MNLLQLFSRRREQPATIEIDNRGMSPYSTEIIQLLETRFDIQPGVLGGPIGHVGAEIGAGKGRLAELFLKHGYTLFATEEDSTNREVCERLKFRFPKLRVIPGSPEATHLPDQSVDFILSERALFWPDQAAVKREFTRILRPGGPVLIITDNRVYGGGKQSEEYNDLLRTHCKTYKEKLAPCDIAAAVQSFFSGSEIYEDAFVGAHALSLEFLLAQTRALDIYPPAGDPARRKLDAALAKFFTRWSIDGRLLEPVVCRVACGRFGKAQHQVEDLTTIATYPSFHEATLQEPAYATH